MHTRATSANHLVSGTCLSDLSQSTSVCSLPKVFVKPTYNESDFTVTKPLADETLPIRQVLVDKWSRPGVQAFLRDVGLGPGTSSAARRDPPTCFGFSCEARIWEQTAPAYFFKDSHSVGVSPGGCMHAAWVGSSGRARASEALANIRQSGVHQGPVPSRIDHTQFRVQRGPEALESEC